MGTTLVIPLLSIPTLTMLLVNVGSAKLQYACTIRRAITANIRHLYFTNLNKKSQDLLLNFYFNISVSILFITYICDSFISMLLFFISSIPFFSNGVILNSSCILVLYLL